MLNNPWFMLAVLFVARTATGYVFQSIGSSGPAIAVGLAVDFALVGTLVGLFKLPGIVLSLPSGTLARRWSDRMLIGGGLTAMALGCVITATAASYPVAATGRLVTGVGATVATLYFTKATLDWFAGSRGLPLAMAILVNSWPFGIALGLMSQGQITLAWGWQTAMMVSAAAALVAAALMMVVYRDPAHRTVPPETGLRAVRALSSHELASMLLIGSVWAFLNVGLAVTFAFAPALLTSIGLDLASSGRMVALATWVGILAIPAGGALVARIGHAQTFIAVCTAASALAFVAITMWPQSSAAYAAFGIAAFAAAGPIMAQPAQRLAPDNRAVGMGVFYTIYYVYMGLLPSVAGLLFDNYGPAAPFYLIAALMILSLGAQLMLRSMPAPLVR